MFEEIDRPARSRRKLDEMKWDYDLENALLSTSDSGRAIKIPLAKFHSSPAKGRLWKLGYKVHHRVMPDRENVAAWVKEEGI